MRKALDTEVYFLHVIHVLSLTRFTALENLI